MIVCIGVLEFSVLAKLQRAYVSEIPIFETIFGIAYHKAWMVMHRCEMRSIPPQFI